MQLAFCKDQGAIVWSDHDRLSDAFNASAGVTFVEDLRPSHPVGRDPVSAAVPVLPESAAPDSLRLSNMGEGLSRANSFFVTQSVAVGPDLDLSHLAVRQYLGLIGHELAVFAKALNLEDLC